MHDVAIAGGGVAGSAAAIALARAGLSVVLLERNRDAARKSCGEGLFPEGVRRLQALGIGPDDIGAFPLDRVRFSAGGQTVATAISPWGRPAYGVRRERLAAALLDAARAAGADVRLGASVRRLRIEAGQIAAFDTTAGTIAATFFVAADGPQSRLRRLAGLDSGRHSDRYGVSAHVRTGHTLLPAIDVLFARGFELYATPVAANEANVAILARRRTMRRFAGDAAGALVQTARAHLGDVDLCDRPLASGPFGRSCTRRWRGNLLLAGDAAGFLDGISGEGMCAALTSGTLAADAIAAVLAGADRREAFREYDRAAAASVRASNLMARLALLISRHQPAARLAIRNLERQPDTFARLVAINAGELPLTALRPRDALALGFGI